MNKTLILIRHAHRDTSDRDQDNGLSTKGKDQAKALKRFFSERFTPEETRQGVWLVSSPKKRCIETLEPIARYVEKSLDKHPDLNEGKATETLELLTKRVQSFLHEWEQCKSPVTVACTHGDWLPIAAQILLGFSHDMKKGSWLEVESGHSRPILKWYIPHFRGFYS